MRHLPVHWSEGMFLRPHHFQAADRFWQEQVGLGELWDHQFNYGVRAIEFSPEALENQQFQLHVLRARMKDGTLISLDPGQEPDRVELKKQFQEMEQMLVNLAEGFSSERVVRIYLAVPKLQLGTANVGQFEVGAKMGLQRFMEREQTLQDETDGGNDQPVRLKSMQIRLLLSTQDLSGYELLPLAQIERSGEGAAVPRIDGNYFPPMLAIDAWPPLGRDIVRAIYDILGKKIETLSQQVLSRGMTLYSNEPGDFDRILMLAQLNAAYTTLAILAFAPGVHPFIAYTELCRIVGTLSIFGKNRRAPDVPNYDHDDLATIFKKVKKMIEDLIGQVQDYEYEQRFFVGVGLGMQVKLESKWLNSDWEWYVGVHKGDLTEQECRHLLSPGQLDWKLGSSQQVEYLFRMRAEGVTLTPLDRPPRALPHSQDWIYYKVTRGNAAWNDVQATETLAMRLKDSLILNRTDLQGRQHMKVAYSNREAVLQFALFAVPTRR